MTKREYEQEIMKWQLEAMTWKAAYFQSLHEIRKANKGIGRLVRGKTAVMETVELLKEGILHPTPNGHDSRATASVKWGQDRPPNGELVDGARDWSAVE